MGKFELFTERSLKRIAGPAATVQARGAFSLNPAAWERLGKPESVLLYFDAEDKRVGIRAASEGEPYAYPVRGNGRLGISRLISAKTFMNANNIDTGKTVPVAVSFEDDMLVLDVSDVMAGEVMPTLGGQNGSAQ